MNKQKNNTLITSKLRNIMKKFSLLGVCLLGAFALSAQKVVVDDVEHALKGDKPDYAAALKNIKPALTDETTKNDPKAWRLAGQAAEGIYDTYFIKQSLGQELTPEESKAAGEGLLSSYNYYLTALPLDQTVDSKGKVKTGKNTKPMLNSIKKNYYQLRNAGVLCFQAQDYKGAYDVWEMYVTLPENQLLGKEAPAAEADTVVGEILYYQLLSAQAAGDYAKSLAKMQPAIDKGYDKLDVYKYGYEAARQLQDSTAMTDIAEKGYKKFGTEDILFVGQLINDRLFKNDIAGCRTLVNEALAATNDVAVQSQLYDILGMVFEQDGDDAQAIENFKKAIELSPETGKNYYDLGRVVYNQAVKLDETINDEAARASQVNPKLLEAAELFEKGYNLDKENLTQVPNILYRLFYRLGEGYQDKASYWENK